MIAGMLQLDESGTRVDVVPPSIGFSVSVRSSIPGRVRWDIRELLDNANLAASLQHELAETPGFSKVVANHRTGRLLVQYNEDWNGTLEQHVREKLQHVANHSFCCGSHDHDHAHSHSHDLCCTTDAAHDHDHDHAGGCCSHDHTDEATMRGYLRNVVIGGVALLGLGVKRLVL